MNGQTGMRLFDQHLHSHYSTDSEESPETVVRAAMKAGLAGLTITDHFDTHPTEWPQCRYNYDGLHEAIASLRAKYSGQIFIGHGIEVCYQPERMDFILDYLLRHEFDMVLLSVHWFRGRALHVREHWDGLDTLSGTREYLETVLDAAKFAGTVVRDGRRVFDVLGHIDLVKRYTQRYYNTFDVLTYKALVDDILRAAIASDIIPEVNASGWRQEVGECFPAEWAVRRYAELGGRCMSIGSDAHKADQIGSGLPEAAQVLKRGGIRSLAVFRGRHLDLVPLP
jgi:histidinol-phosphatase (PHP family)